MTWNEAQTAQDEQRPLLIPANGARPAGATGEAAGEVAAHGR
jgi:hypothetical protein